MGFLEKKESGGREPSKKDGRGEGEPERAGPKWRKASRKWDRLAELNTLTDGAGTCLLNLATGDLV